MPPLSVMGYLLLHVHRATFPLGDASDHFLAEEIPICSRSDWFEVGLLASVGVASNQKTDVFHLVMYAQVLLALGRCWSFKSMERSLLIAYGGCQLLLSSEG